MRKLFDNTILNLTGFSLVEGVITAPGYLLEQGIRSNTGLITDATFMNQVLLHEGWTFEGVLNTQEGENFPLMNVIVTGPTNQKVSGWILVDTGNPKPVGAQQVACGLPAKKPRKIEGSTEDNGDDGKSVSTNIGVFPPPVPPKNEGGKRPEDDGQGKRGEVSCQGISAGVLKITLNSGQEVTVSETDLLMAAPGTLTDLTNNDGDPPILSDFQMNDIDACEKQIIVEVGGVKLAEGLAGYLEIALQITYDAGLVVNYVERVFV